MFSFILWVIAFYLLYRFVFGFVVPVFLATKKVKAQMKNMQEQMNQQSTGTKSNNTSSSAGSYTKADSNVKSTPKGDYIDFEEIK